MLLNRLTGPANDTGRLRIKRRSVYRSAMNVPRKIPRRVILGLAAAVVIDTALQIFWKTAVLKLPDDAQSYLSFLAIFQEPLFIVVVCIMSLQFFNWMAVLNHADLSFAQPFTALSYVGVGAISAVFLNERLDFQQMLGIACVIAGVGFISQTDHVTPRDAGEADPPVGNAASHPAGSHEIMSKTAG